LSKALVGGSFLRRWQRESYHANAQRRRQRGRQGVVSSRVECECAAAALLAESEAEEEEGGREECGCRYGERGGEHAGGRAEEGRREEEAEGGLVSGVEVACVA